MNRLPPDAVNPTTLHRVLVIKLRHHGDVLLTSPVISMLKALAPGAEIDALVYADTAPMLEGHPSLHRLFTVVRSGKLGVFAALLAEIRLLRDLRARRYDLIVSLTDHNRGARFVRLLRPMYSVAPAKKGAKWYTRAFTHLYPVIGGNRRHTVEIHLDALRRLGLHAERPGDKRLTIIPGAEADLRAGAILRDAGLVPKGYVLIHPGSRWLFKCWQPEKMAAVADALAEAGHRIVITGAPDPAELAMVEAMVATMASKPLNLAGKTGLKDLAALIRDASLFLGVDSVPMHIAAAMQTPAVALFGPSGDIEWGPWMSPHEIIRSDAHACRPCGRAGCGDSKRSDCLDTLTVATVLAACRRQLESRA